MVLALNVVALLGSGIAVVWAIYAIRESRRAMLKADALVKRLEAELYWCGCHHVTVARCRCWDSVASTPTPP